MSIKMLMLAVLTFIIVLKNAHCEIPTGERHLIAGRSNPTYYGDCVRYQQSTITKIGNKYKFYYDIDYDALEKHQIHEETGENGTSFRYRILDEECDATKETKFWEAMKRVRDKDINGTQSKPTTTIIQTEEQKLQEWDDVWSGKDKETKKEDFNQHVCNPKLMLECIEGKCKCRKNDPYDTSLTKVFQGLVENSTTKRCDGTPYLKNTCSWGRPEVGTCNFDCVYGALCESQHETTKDVGLHAARCVCSKSQKCRCADDTKLKCVAETSKNHGSINQPILDRFVKAAVIVILLVLLLSHDVVNLVC